MTSKQAGDPTPHDTFVQVAELATEFANVALAAAEAGQYEKAQTFAQLSIMESTLGSSLLTTMLLHAVHETNNILTSTEETE